MLTAKQAFEISQQVGNKYLKACLALIEKAAMEGRTSITMQFTDKGGNKENSIPLESRAILVSSLERLGYKITWQGEVSPKFAPDYRHYRIQVEWESITDICEEKKEEIDLELVDIYSKESKQKLVEEAKQEG